MSAQSAIYNPTQTTSAATGDGFSTPRLTTAGRLAISFTTSDKGMMVFDTDLNNLFIWNGSAWESVPASGDSSNTQVIFDDNDVLVGDPGLTYDKSVARLNVGPGVQIWKGNLQDATSTGVGSTTLAATIAGGINNTAIGYRSMYRATTGANNVGVGALTIAALGYGGSDCVAVGYGAMSATTGSQNTALGSFAGYTISSGINNVAIGYVAMASSTASSHTGNANIAIGATAMYSNAAISGSDNIGIGRDVYRFLSSGSGNVAIGQAALYQDATGSNNTAVGYNALSATVVSDQTAVGAYALYSLQNGANNAAVGRDALRALVSSSNCTALGYYAARATTAADVTAIGSNALALSTGGNGNTAVGSGSMGSAIVTGVYNTCVGAGSGYVVTSGAHNVFIGTDAGSVTTTGSSNICIGRGSVSAATDSNVIAIGSSTYFVGTNGAANTYYNTATAGAVALPAAAVGFWRVSINGTFRKIAVYAD